ncbi:MAG: hypothetical protein HYV09_18085 [Deltaproteobacteria bacterium]|nr:hypothetical protein [Deltaproteobacteria bacterium]
MQRRNFTIAVTIDAIAVVATTHPVVDETTAPRRMLLVAGEERELAPHFDVVRLEPIARTARSIEIVERVCALLEAPPIAVDGRAPHRLENAPIPVILVDVTGAARPVLDLLGDRGVPARGIGLVGAGGEVSAASQTVAEREPLARLAALMARGRVGLARGKTEERVRTSILSASVEAANVGPALAIAIAVWSAERNSRPLFGHKSDLGLQGGRGW